MSSSGPTGASRAAATTAAIAACSRSRALAACATVLTACSANKLCASLNASQPARAHAETHLIVLCRNFSKLGLQRRCLRGIRKRTGVVRAVVITRMRQAKTSVNCAQMLDLWDNTDRHNTHGDSREWQGQVRNSDPASHNYYSICNCTDGRPSRGLTCATSETWYT